MVFFIIRFPVFVTSVYSFAKDTLLKSVSVSVTFAVFPSFSSGVETHVYLSFAPLDFSFTV